MIKQIVNVEDKKNIAQTVLYDLHEWFGIAEYTENYINESNEMPFLQYMK